MLVTHFPRDAQVKAEVLPARLSSDKGLRTAVVRGPGKFSSSNFAAFNSSK